MGSTYNAEIHGFKKNRYGDQVLLKVADISPFVFTANVQDVKSVADLANQVRVGDRCPILDQWDANCNGECSPVETAVEMARQELLPPKKSGAEAGKSRDPNLDYNYRWEFVGVLNSNATKQSDVRGNPTASQPQSVSSKPILDGDLNTLRREMATNDRTALMQAVVKYGDQGKDAETLVTAEIFANWLNTRSTVRLTSNLVRKAEAEGAVVTSVKPVAKQPHLDDPATVPPEILAIKNRADLDAWITSDNIDPANIVKALSDKGFKNSAEYLKTNSDKGVQGLAIFIYENVERSDNGDIPW